MPRKEREKEELWGGEEGWNGMGEEEKEEEEEKKKQRSGVNNCFGLCSWWVMCVLVSSETVLGSRFLFTQTLMLSREDGNTQPSFLVLYEWAQQLSQIGARFLFDRNSSDPVHAINLHARNSVLAVPYYILPL